MDHSFPVCGVSDPLYFPTPTLMSPLGKELHGGWAPWFFEPPFKRLKVQVVWERFDFSENRMTPGRQAAQPC